MLTTRETDLLLELQSHHGGTAPAADGFFLGNILVASGKITRDPLDSAVLSQRASGLPIGEELIDAGHASRKQVEVGLLLQKKFIAYALVLANGLTPLSPVMPLAQAAQGSAEKRLKQVLATASMVWSKPSFWMRAMGCLRWASTVAGQAWTAMAVTPPCGWRGATSGLSPSLDEPS